jgi:putative DNA primase/helicase
LLHELDQFTYDDAGQGDAFAYLFRDRLRYLPGAGWYIWTGRKGLKAGRWKLDRQDAVMRYAITAARARFRAVSSRKIDVPDDAPDAEELRKQLEQVKRRNMQWIAGAGSCSRIQNSIQMARTVQGMIVNPNTFDNVSHLLGVQNGVVDLSTGQLIPARQEQYITHSTGLPYFSDAQCPRFERFIHEIFDGDTDLVAYIQRAIGYSLTGDISEQCFFLCHGTGANGKSTLLNVIKGLGGEYAANTSFNTFEHGRQSGPGQELVLLHGRRIVLSSETDDGSRLNEARVKAITGGDEVTGRYLFSRHDITFVPTFKLWLATNHKPTIRGSDDGIWRRIRLIPFLVSFSKEKRDRNLEGALKQELPGILAWAVRGALDWYAQGLGEPEIVRSATSEYRDESDILGQFLREKTQQVTASSVRSAQLYDAYRAWTESNGMYTLSSVKLAKALQGRGFEKKRTSQGMVWQGLTVREETTEKMSRNPA